MVLINNEWDKILKDTFNCENYKNLREFLKTEYSSKKIFPDMFDIFNALKTTDYKDVKVVILGQDPYHNINQAHGFSFSVKVGVEAPPSLKNIYKELQADLGCFIPNNGYLKQWAEQGVLLLNTILTVEKNKPLSHKNKGWEDVTDDIIKALNNRSDSVIFLLWGAPARAKKALITNKKHYILEAPHPSPLSAYNGFFGCKHFSKANNILINENKTPIDWQIPNI